MKKLALPMLIFIMFACTACNSKDAEYFEPSTASPSPIIISPSGSNLPDIVDTGSGDPSGPDGANSSPGTDPTAGSTPAFLSSPLEAIQEGMKEKYEGEGTEVVELKGFKVTLGEAWVLTDENANGSTNERIIDGPVRYTTDDGGSMILYVQENQQGWDATDEEVNRNVADTVVQSNDSYLLLEQSTMDTPLGKGLMIYYRTINPDDVEHNQRACLVLVPKDDKILAISAGAYDSNDDQVFYFAYKAMGRALASAEAEYI